MPPQKWPASKERAKRVLIVAGAPVESSLYYRAGQMKKLIKTNKQTKPPNPVPLSQGWEVPGSQRTCTLPPAQARTTGKRFIDVMGRENSSMLAAM